MSECCDDRLRLVRVCHVLGVEAHSCSNIAKDILDGRRAY